MDTIPSWSTMQSDKSLANPAHIKDDPGLMAEQGEGLLAPHRARLRKLRDGVPERRPRGEGVAEGLVEFTGDNATAECYAAFEAWVI